MFEVVSFRQGSEFFQGAASIIFSCIENFVREENQCTLMLSGGRTPKPICAELASYGDGLVWSRVQVFWSDERYVPRDSPVSNAGSLVPFFSGSARCAHFFPFETEFPVEESAERYSRCLMENVEFKEGIPSIDAAVLGFGLDGHIASIFSKRDVSGDRPWVFWNFEGAAPSECRLTVSMDVLLASKKVFLLCGDDSKYAFLQSACTSESDLPLSYLVANHTNLTVLVGGGG